MFKFLSTMIILFACISFAHAGIVKENTVLFATKDMNMERINCELATSQYASRIEFPRNVRASDGSLYTITGNKKFNNIIRIRIDSGIHNGCKGWTIKENFSQHKIRKSIKNKNIKIIKIIYKSY